MNKIKYIIYFFALFVTSLNAESINKINDPLQFKAIKNEEVVVVKTATIKSNHNSLSEENANSVKTFGFAVLPSSLNSVFPPAASVHLTNLLFSSGKVSLTKGCLKLSKGIYRIGCGLNLQNLGKEGTIEAWLSIKTSRSNEFKAIDNSSIRANIALFNPPSEPIFVSLSGSILLKVRKTSLISLNYLTKGNVLLTSVPPPISGNGMPAPFSFFLLANKIAEI
ncbi:MAG: hypothetical protein Q8K60_02055 [Parachlamydiaceae bacterium]|nr:hypothetical protein [Parachlamydiaceae bacterium]